MKPTIEDYQEMIAICEMRIFQLQQEVYEESANSIYLQVCNDRIMTYKAIINRLSQRVINLKANDKSNFRQEV